MDSFFIWVLRGPNAKKVLSLFGQKLFMVEFFHDISNHWINLAQIKFRQIKLVPAIFWCINRGQRIHIYD